MFVCYYDAGKSKPVTKKCKFISETFCNRSLKVVVLSNNDQKHRPVFN
ncbi:hypothetical protein GFO_0527 [Christiangramia forsetii KT0803]|uniref:Uncharacterized protein n=1 Tax=Christiangramia forsetii (strain DSM 17595 / CGMCC 1.15422 / KT0803) TaxID=411154 RepID=A0LYR5_CHRFK|nr:hypothetical protein GFO_0527 [Christiangramia forsetii KT0803]